MSQLHMHPFDPPRLDYMRSLPLETTCNGRNGGKKLTDECDANSK